jgi:cation:H+ antiporter
LAVAVGNLLGSTLFNLSIIAVDDLFHRGRPLLEAVSAAHAVTAVSAIVMAALVMVWLILRPQRRLLRAVSWVSVGLLSVVLLNAALLFVRGG